MPRVRFATLGFAIRPRWGETSRCLEREIEIESTGMKLPQNRKMERCLKPFAFSLFTIACLSMPGVCQEVQKTRLDNGLSQLESKYLQLTTDLPLNDEITSLPKIFDQAVQQWSARFAVDPIRVQGAKAIACLMKDRSRFVELDLMPPETGNFRHGYQLDDRLFLMEQPSVYYRRHLLLHEGTHWFMWKFLSGNGPPWFSEGICEQLGTHDWDGLRLTMGIIPFHHDRFPYWGRLKLIHDSLNQNAAPTLNAILGYGDTAHRTDEPYAWSWAAMLFFSNHPKYQHLLRRISQPPLDYSNQITIALKRELADTWPTVDAEWRVFVSELDFGFSPEHSFVDIASIPSHALRSKELRTIRCDRGWQSMGLFIDKGQRIRVAAQGTYTIRTKQDSYEKSSWKCEPQGVTLEYHQGQPLGRLLATIVPITKAAIDKPVRQCTPYPIGRKTTWDAPESGILLLKINENSAGLADNTGELKVTMEPDAS